MGVLERVYQSYDIVNLRGPFSGNSFYDFEKPVVLADMPINFIRVAARHSSYVPAKMRRSALVPNPVFPWAKCFCQSKEAPFFAEKFSAGESHWSHYGVYDEAGEHGMSLLETWHQVSKIIHRIDVLLMAAKDIFTLFARRSPKNYLVRVFCSYTYSLDQ